MTVTNAAQSTAKTVADPNAAYESLRPLWDKCRAVSNGERYVKDYDGIIDVTSFTNLLIPFSPSMSQQQYNFYKAEAELPGITAQFSKMLVGGLLRKKPVLTLPDTVPKEAADWIMNQFGQDGGSLTAFMDEALWEEMQTSRAWIYVDHPVASEDMDPEQLADMKPYPVLWEADVVINWRIRKNAQGKGILDRVITYGLTEEFETNEFHPTYTPTVWVHELNEQGKYQIRVFKQEAPSTDVKIVNGRQDKEPDGRAVFKEQDGLPAVLVNGEMIDFIPAWPLNGSIEPPMPILTAIIDKEVALYNKVSRRNHLLYGAATYTPIVHAEMTDEAFDDMTKKGLGTWLKVGPEEDITVLKTPTEALADMDRAILAGIDEMAKLGIRMLSPETEQSGVALQLRNASQTAQLGTLNSKASSTMTQVITFMLNWKYKLDLKSGDVDFSLSADFNPTPLGADWLRLVTEWYQSSLIPRSVWLEVLKHNDMVSPDYDDKQGQQEITSDQDFLMKSQGLNDDFANKINAALGNGPEKIKKVPGDKVPEKNDGK